MAEKNITINILPQDPLAWFFIAIAIFAIVMGTSVTPSKEREKTVRLDRMLERGITNAEDIAIIEGF